MFAGIKQINIAGKFVIKKKLTIFCAMNRVYKIRPTLIALELDSISITNQFESKWMIINLYQHRQNDHFFFDLDWLETK